MIAAISVGAWPHASDAANGNVSFDRAASAASQVRHGVVVTVASQVTTLRVPANASEAVHGVSSHSASAAVSSQGRAICASQLRSHRR